MTSIPLRTADLDGRIAATASLPSDDQAEALIGLLQSLDHADLAPFVALLIGEVVALREICAARRTHRPLPLPSPAAASVSA